MENEISKIKVPRLIFPSGEDKEWYINSVQWEKYNEICHHNLVVYYSLTKDVHANLKHFGIPNAGFVSVAL